MKKKTILILAIALIYLLTVGGFFLHGYLSRQADPEQGASAQAADFTVYDLAGNPVKLSDYLGQPVVLNFWASWCGPCKSEMPDFDAAYAQYGDQVQFMMVNITDGMQETLESASAFIAGAGYSFPVFYDTSVEAATTYGVSAIPATYFIDEDGYIVSQNTGALTKEALDAGISKILP